MRFQKVSIEAQSRVWDPSSAVLRSHPDTGEFGSAVPSDHGPAMHTVHPTGSKAKGQSVTGRTLQSCEPWQQRQAGGNGCALRSALPWSFGPLLCGRKCISEGHMWRRPVCLMMSKDQKVTGRCQCPNIPTQDVSPVIQLPPISLLS